MSAASVSDSSVRGYLVVTVAEASGRNKEEDDVWDPGFYEGFVKVEVRGPGMPTCKSISSIKRVLSGQISWQEDIVCEVLEGANELRVMLCKEKRNPNTGATGQSVVAACGIYVEDILDAVPIDKYFELFKPKNGGDGGFIRVAMNFSVDSPDDATDLEPAPYVPSTSFKSYSKEQNSTSASSRNGKNDAVEDGRIDDDRIDDGRVDDVIVDGNDINKGADTSGRVNQEMIDGYNSSQSGGKPEKRRRIPIAKIAIIGAIAAGLGMAQRRQ